MNPCVNKFYVNNKKIISCDEFDENLIKEGKSIYEVIRVINSKPLFLKEHLKRMESSANLAFQNVGKFEVDTLFIEENIASLIKTNESMDGNIKIILNVEGDADSLLAFYIKHSYPTEEMYHRGVKTILFYDERSNPNAKIINDNFKKRVNKVLTEKNVYEAILVDHEGYITEGSRSNIFIVKGDTVLTTPGEKVLPGITRKKIIEVISEKGIKFVEGNIRAEDLKEMDGLFISGTSPKVLPICRVDDMVYNSSENNIITDIKNGFDDKIRENLL